MSWHLQVTDFPLQFFDVMAYHICDSLRISNLFDFSS